MIPRDKYQITPQLQEQFSKIESFMKYFWDANEMIALNPDGEIRNFVVAEILDRVLTPLLEKQSKATIEIKNSSIIVSSKIPDGWVHKLKVDRREGVDSKTATQYSFIETFMDFWLRYKSTRVAMEYNDESISFYLYCMTQEQLKSYFEDNSYVGWNPHGGFWKRDWLQNCQREKAIGGGKANVK